MKIALFAGTFDPITKGHEYVIERATKTFDKLVVAVCVNSQKHATFSVEDRLEMITLVTKKYSNVEVLYHEGLLVDLMKQKNITYNVRGIRNNVDREYENMMQQVNYNLYNNIVTIFFPCPSEYSEISSTNARNNILDKKTLEKYLSSEVIEFIEKLKK